MSYPPYAGIDTYGQPLVDAWWTKGWTSQNPDYLVAPSPNGIFPGAPNVTYVNVTHPYFDFDGSPLGGFLTFMPASNASLTQSGTTWRLPQRLSGTTTFGPYYSGFGWHQDSSGSIYLQRGELFVKLMQTDASGLVTDSGLALTYLVIEHFEGGRKFQISVPGASSNPVDLDSLIIPGTLETYVFDPTNVLADEWETTVTTPREFVQAFTSQTTVTVNHNLGCYPDVIVMDTSGNLVVANVQYTSLNQVVVTFSQSFSGTVVCNA
jgi:hypothetical protein